MLGWGGVRIKKLEKMKNSTEVVHFGQFSLFFFLRAVGLKVMHNNNYMASFVPLHYWPYMHRGWKKLRGNKRNLEKIMYSEEEYLFHKEKISLKNSEFFLFK